MNTLVENPRPANTSVKTLIGICLIVEVIVWFTLIGFSPERLETVAFYPDTNTYLRVAKPLVEEGILVASPRTLGYPLVLALFLVLAGPTGALFLILILQLILNIIFTAWFKRFLDRLIPGSSPAFRILATAIFFVAGLDHALRLLTDFLSAFFFFVFLFCLLFRQSKKSVLLAAAAIFIATILRPSLTLLPLLLPLMAWIINKGGIRISWRRLALWGFSSILATSISVAYQYYSFNTLGPSTIMHVNMATTFNYAGITPQRPDLDPRERFITLQHDFKLLIARKLNKPVDSLSIQEIEQNTMGVFLAHLRSHPVPLVKQLTTTFLKALFGPVETVISKTFAALDLSGSYNRFVRLVLFLLFLPFWILGCIPPIRWKPPLLWFYFLAMLLLFYIIGPASFNAGHGERLRFSILPYLLPILVVNLTLLMDRYGIQIGHRHTPIDPDSPKR